MNLKKYQKEIEKTWIPNEYNLLRIVFGIAGESGEICELYKKYFRKDFKYIKPKLKKESGNER
jgi:hypothetical protein